MKNNISQRGKYLPEEDLIHIFTHTTDLWKDLRNKSVFITGGTGFFGKWFIESLLYINKRLELNAYITVLTRNKEKFRIDYPSLYENSYLNFIEGDISDFAFTVGEFEYVIHAAIDYKDDSLSLFDSCVNGTMHIMDFAEYCHATKVLLISSGAVYGKQPNEISHICESYCGSPEPFENAVAYGMAKRTSEFISSEYAKKSNIQVKIARCFAFAGPYLPLDKGSAIGNFIRDALDGKDIIIKGDGTPYRSYMYASDLMIWLWTILFKGVSCRPYNVGSDEEISIADLASEVINLIDSSLNKIFLQEKDTSRQIDRYVPSIERAKTELGLEVLVTRKNAILKMSNFYKY